MPQLQLNFLPDESETPNDEQLLLQLVYGLCGQINNAREEKVPSFYSSVGIPYPQIRRLAKLLVEKLDLPVPIERVDEWVDWQRNNQCWIVSKEMSAEADRLAELISQ